VLLQEPVGVANGPSFAGIPPTPKLSSGERLRVIWQNLYSCFAGPFVRSYERLPWLTRKTIQVALQLSMVLYIFFTAPFRVAFYYDPRSSHDLHAVEADHWTPELSIFIALDSIADIIGLIEFVAFYKVWKAAFYELSTLSSMRSAKSRASDTDRVTTAKLMIRRASSANFQLGRVNWTISSIKPLSSMPGDDASRANSQQRFMLARNMELVLEVVALMPIEVALVALGAFNALHLARLTKLCRLYRLRQCLARIAKLYSDRLWVQGLSSSGVDSLVRTIGICAGMCHLTACVYMLLGHLQCGVDLHACDPTLETSWVVRDQLYGASVARKYGRTLYWATRTLVLLGYDDVTPVSTAETLYVVFVTILGALFGSSLLANFLFLFRFRNARYAAYAAHVDSAREYMRLQDIPRSVPQQVTAYFNYSWSTHRSLDSEEALQLLPQHLQSKVIATLRTNRIAQVCFFLKESVEFINELALALVRRVYSPGDQIIEPKANAQMFFVIRGLVVLSNLNGSKPNECTTGDFFAEMCLLFPDIYSQKATAKTFCELYVLTKAKFDEALAEHHPGAEMGVRRRMAETLERYTLQLRKTKKILGLQDGFENVVSGGRTSLGRFSAGRASVGRSKSSQGRSSVGTVSAGRSSIGRSTRAVTAGGANTGEWRYHINWRYPGSSFRLLWDTARLVLIIYVAFEVPYFAVFISMTEGTHLFAVESRIDLRYGVTMLAEVFFAVDLVLRSRYFAYMDYNVMLAIVRPDHIFTAYKANGFFLDLLAWLPVGVVLDSLPTDSFQIYSSLFRLFRLLRLRLVPGLMQDLTDLYGASSKLQIVTSLVLGVSLMLHIVGCVWFEMALFPPDSESDHQNSASLIAELTRSECLRQATQFHNCSWVKFDCYAHLGVSFPHENPDSTYQAQFAYLRSVYWAVITLTAVGYGDIVAYSTAESYFAAVWVFLGGIINFAVMGAMSSTISNMMAPHHHFMEKINTVNSIMERVSISKHLTGEIRRFYHQQFVGHKQAYESQLLSNLPDRLCYQISSQLHSSAVKSVTLFDSASIEFLREVTGKFRNRSFQNGETICLEGDVCREFFVFLHGSKVNIFFKSRKVPIRALHGGDCYGVNEFLLKRSHLSTLIAASLVHASVMSREQFDGIQRKFAGDLRDMREEAQALCDEDRVVMKRIMANLARIKLQPHLLQTPSLFYQRDVAFIGADDDTRHKLHTTSDTFTTAWNACITLWNLYNAVFVIFRICFQSHLHFSSGTGAAVWVADLCCDVCFAADIYLRLYYFGNSDAGIENLLERKEVDKQYLRSSAFKWDLVASLPIYTPYASGSLVASLCRLPRLARCADLWAYLDNVIVEIQQHFASRNVSAYLSPVKLLIVLVLVAHYVGCIFLLISEHECEQLDRCWMVHDPLLHEYHNSVPILYGKVFYWAITTLLLVGSREVVPRGMAGTLWTGFTCLCCTFIIGHIVGEISELILELGKETKQYKSRIASFESFAHEHELSSALRERVTFFFRVEFEHTKGTNMCSTMHDLSANLRLKFMLEIYGRSIEKLPISSFLTATQVNNLALRLQSQLYIPGDNILVEGTFGSRLCSLRKGMAAAYWTKAVASVALLLEGAFFGEIAFFLPNQRRLATVRATTSCEVLHITKQDWQELWMPTDDTSDTNVQKHAQHAILGWVNSRLQRYQRGCLRTVSRAKSAVSLRRPSIKPPANPSTRRLSRFFAKDKDAVEPAARVQSNDGHVLVWAPTPPRKLSKVEICRMFVSPTIQLLEKKAEYVLSKSTACAQLESARETARRDSSQSGHRISYNNDSSKRGRWWHVGSKVSHAPAADAPKKTEDLRQRQFIVDLNPINEYLDKSLGADNIRELGPVQAPRSFTTRREQTAHRFDSFGGWQRHGRVTSNPHPSEAKEAQATAAISL
jgi:CRP-like cAMP-binding protein